MSIFGFGFKYTSKIDVGLDSSFPLEITKQDFINNDIKAIYNKILIDVVERTHGISKEYEPMLWDNYIQDEVSKGIISLLVEAMTYKQDLFIVYDRGLKTVRKAKDSEISVIREDYRKGKQTSNAVFISFREYKRTDMLRIYSGFEFCTISSLNKILNISKAMQLKIKNLRSSVSLNDSDIAREQAVQVANALKNGKDVMIDAEDIIETAMPDTSSADKAMEMINSKRAFYLNLPLSYISGEQTGGIGSTGEADTKAIERGLKPYYISIIKPVLKVIFGNDTTFKSEDFRQINSSLDMFRTFELAENEIVSKQTQREIMANAFNLDPVEEEKRINKEMKEMEKEQAENGNKIPSEQDIEESSTEDETSKVGNEEVNSQ